jgi:hypothetical protein
MKFEQQNVWNDKNDDALLRQTKNGEWSVLPSTVNAERLAELRDAINDALDRYTPPTFTPKDA